MFLPFLLEFLYSVAPLSVSPVLRLGTEPPFHSLIPALSAPNVEANMLSALLLPALSDLDAEADMLSVPLLPVLSALDVEADMLSVPLLPVLSALDVEADMANILSLQMDF